MARGKEIVNFLKCLLTAIRFLKMKNREKGNNYFLVISWHNSWNTGNILDFLKDAAKQLVSTSEVKVGSIGILP